MENPDAGRGGNARLAQESSSLRPACLDASWQQG
jgi:hypothetical protein